MIDNQIKEAFDERFQHWNIKEKLQKLDQIIQDDSQDGQEQWRPNATPLDSQAAHDWKTVNESSQKLDKEVMTKLNEELTDLHNQVQMLQKETKENEEELKRIVEL